MRPSVENTVLAGTETVMVGDFLQQQPLLSLLVQPNGSSSYYDDYYYTVIDHLIHGLTAIAQQQ